MELKELEAKIEAILFTMGEAVEAERIAAVLGHDVALVRKVIRNMMDTYEESGHGIQIIELDGAFQLCTKPSMYETLIQLTHIPKKHILTDILLETLSIVAYKQPITKQEIEAIRGVSCDHVINKLIDYKLIVEVGRLDAPGRPILFGTSDEFLRSFGLVSLDELPIIQPEDRETFMREAEEEIQLTLNI